MMYTAPTVSIKDIEMSGFLCNSQEVEAEVDQTVILGEEEVVG